jgi:hypothetical protein
LLACDFKEVILGGRDASGMNTESEFFSCTSTPAGQMCGQGRVPTASASQSRRSAALDRRVH